MDNPTPVVMAGPAVSDPTPLATQQLQREIGTLKEIIETRFEAIDKATELFETNLNRVPTDIQIEIAHLREYILEKFRAVEIQFTERDSRSDRYALYSKDALAAALQAAKELGVEHNNASAMAIAKSDADVSKRIDQQALLISGSSTTLNDKIEDIKQRITRMEGNSGGMEKLWGYIVGVSGVVIAIISLIALLWKR